MTARLMVQGTGSDVGKSLIVAGLCRALKHRGFNVRPFKPQNMSNNAAVTIDGGEIGRAQALQARACGVLPTLHMNPILLKPESAVGAQLIVQGQRMTTMKARSYMKKKGSLMPSVLESFHALSREADIIIIEGAGSPAEVNLREGDIANMGFAHAADAPVLLLGDIHRGGVIASIVGTLQVLEQQDAMRIQSFAINNFHGDPTLFDAGVDYLESLTKRFCAGVIPHFLDAKKLPAEDTLSLDRDFQLKENTALTIAVPQLKRIANFDDLDPLRQEKDVTLIMVAPGEVLPGNADLVLLPGSKTTIADLIFFREQGWDIDLKAHVRRGGYVLGLCGGYQMLGSYISDPDGMEGAPITVEGLGLLDVETYLTPAKTLKPFHGVHKQSDCAVSGYEIHVGKTEGPDCHNGYLLTNGHTEGAVSNCGRIAGTYVHGLFSSDAFRRAFLQQFNVQSNRQYSYEKTIEETLDKLAKHLEDHLAIDHLLALAHGKDKLQKVLNQ